MLTTVSTSNVIPPLNSINFYLWWHQACDSLSTVIRRGFNTLVVLEAWTIWKTRNDAVFHGAAPKVDKTLLLEGGS